MNFDATPYYQMRMQEELARRLRENPHYSMRAFAKQIEVSPALLSRVLNGKRNLSLKSAQKVTLNLKLTAHETRAFLKSVPSKNNSLEPSPLNEEIILTKAEVQQDLLEMIGDWHHAAILELAQTTGFKNDSHAIAKRLKMNVADARSAVERLIRLGMLVKSSDGVLAPSKLKYSIADKTKTTPFLKRREKQIREKAIESLMNDPIEARAMTSLTLAIDPEKLPLARKLIQDFTNTLWETLDTGKKKEVFQLSVSFFPLSRRVP